MTALGAMLSEAEKERRYPPGYREVGGSPPVTDETLQPGNVDGDQLVLQGDDGLVASGVPLPRAAPEKLSVDTA